jgi:hypothetical protein
MEEPGMKLRIAAIATMFIGLCFSSACIHSPADEQVSQVSQMGSMEEPILTVLNPLGTPPPIKLLPMAPRLDTINGKTIYIVNDGYPGSGILLKELKAVFEEKYPNTTFVYRDKKTGMARKDPALWDEMGQKGDAMIIALGH